MNCYLNSRDRQSVVAHAVRLALACVSLALASALRTDTNSRSPARHDATFRPPIQGFFLRPSDTCWLEPVCRSVCATGSAQYCPVTKARAEPVAHQTSSRISLVLQLETGKLRNSPRRTRRARRMEFDDLRNHVIGYAIEGPSQTRLRVARGLFVNLHQSGRCRDRNADEFHVTKQKGHAFFSFFDYFVLFVSFVVVLTRLSYASDFRFYRC